MSLLPKVSVYQDQMSTDAANKVGMEELTSRQAANVITDILTQHGRIGHRLLLGQAQYH